MNALILSGSSHKKLAQSIATILRIPLVENTSIQFSNTEIKVDIHYNLRNKHIFIIQTGTFDEKYSINDYLMETLIMIDACKRSMAATINLIMPHYPYARQDKKENSREPITARLVADLLQTAGLSRLIVMDLHSPQIQGFFNIPVDNLYSRPLVIEYLKNKYDLDESYMLVSPDSGATKRTLSFARALKLNTVIMHKQRNYNKINEVDKMMLIGCGNDIDSKNLIILDDMCDTAGTLVKCVEHISSYNPKSIVCIVTHGILSGQAISLIENCDALNTMVITNSIPQNSHSKIDIIKIDKLLAEVIKINLNGGSVSRLF